jgi:predicted transcriptional regulator
MTIQEIRSKRIASEISATLLATKAGVNRSRLSHIERGYVQPTESELRKLEATLDALIRAKSAVLQAAASVGWPLGRIE